MDVKFWQQRPVLITGATGLVGSWLTRSLTDQHALVTALVQDVHERSPFWDQQRQNPIHWVYGQMEDLSTLEKAIMIAQPDTVFHLGAQTIVGNALANPWMTFESNVRATYNLLEACRRYGQNIKAIVIASSDKAYGDSERLPYTEDMRLNGIAPYDASKVCTEVIAQSYAKTYGLPIIIARCGNIYGEGDINFSRLVPGTIKSLLHDERPIIRSDGKFMRDYVYVKNVAYVYMSLASLAHAGKAIGEAFNYSDDQPLSVLEMVTLISRLMDKKHLAPIIQNNVRHEILNQHLSSAKLRAHVNLKTLANLEQSLLSTIAWYRDFLR